MTGCTSCGPDPNNSPNPLIREYGSVYQYASPRFAPGIRHHASAVHGDVTKCYLDDPIRNFYSAGDDLTSERRRAGVLPALSEPGYGCMNSGTGMRTASVRAPVYSNIVYDNMPGSDMKTIETFSYGGDQLIYVFVRLAIIALIIYVIMHFMKKGDIDVTV